MFPSPSIRIVVSAFNPTLLMAMQQNPLYTSDPDNVMEDFTWPDRALSPLNTTDAQFALPRNVGVNDFTNSIDNLLKMLKDILRMCGNIKIIWLDNSLHNNIQYFIDHLFSMTLLPLITNPLDYQVNVIL